MTNETATVLSRFNLADWLGQQTGHYSLDIPQINLGEKVVDDPREWLVTNGLGSYASANIWGANARRYHGLLVASLDPPVSRTIMLSRIDETVGPAGQDGGGEEIRLSTNYWSSGVAAPLGCKHVAAFTVYPVPTWVFEVEGGVLIKQVAMLPERQEVIVGYSLIADQPIDLRLDFLANYRDFHGETHGHPNWLFNQKSQDGHVDVQAFEGSAKMRLSFDKGKYTEKPIWYWGYCWPRERERGLADNEDNYHLGYLNVELQPGESITLHAAVDDGQPAFKEPIAQVVKTIAENHNHLIDQACQFVHWSLSQDKLPQDLKKLIVAADEFVVQRASTQSPTIIAGYHWFNDWGRDSMISLPGLTLVAGRPQVARGILTTFGSYVSEGMLPNNFPDRGETPGYNTADATLWWAYALNKYLQYTKDMDFVASQLPLLDSVADWHIAGTRYRLQLDHNDGLLGGGKHGIALTWMDARVGDYAVTPRIGKPVEINALWFNFLKILAHLHQQAGDSRQDRVELYTEMADCTLRGFSEFWNEKESCLYDVIGFDGVKDASIRPNQLFAVSLPYDLLDNERAKSVIDVVEKYLLTPAGLRTLAPNDPNYKSRYGDGKPSANQWDRDITYHQGTAWPFLFGAWADARVKAYGKNRDNFKYMAGKLKPMREHILQSGVLGSVSEIFDADSFDGAVQKAQGCVAQAWSVAELLRIFFEYPELLSE